MRCLLSISRLEIPRRCSPIGNKLPVRLYLRHGSFSLALCDLRGDRLRRADMPLAEICVNILYGSIAMFPIRDTDMIHAIGRSGAQRCDIYRYLQPVYLSPRCA